MFKSILSDCHAAVSSRRGSEPSRDRSRALASEGAFCAWRVTVIPCRTLLLLACTAYAQPPQAQCVEPLCVNRLDDRATGPVPGMLRYAVREAPRGSTITFAPSLNGKTIKLDVSSMKNAIRISQDVTLQGPGSSLLAISGGRGTRLFVI